MKCCYPHISPRIHHDFMIFVPCSHFAYSAPFSMAHATTDRRLVFLSVVMRWRTVFEWKRPGCHGLTTWHGANRDKVERVRQTIKVYSRDAREVAGVRCSTQSGRLCDSIRTRFCSCLGLMWDWWDSKCLLRKGAMRHLSRQRSRSLWCIGLCTTRAREA